MKSAPCYATATNTTPVQIPPAPVPAPTPTVAERLNAEFPILAKQVGGGKWDRTSDDARDGHMLRTLMTSVLGTRVSVQSAAAAAHRMDTQLMKALGDPCTGGTDDRASPPVAPTSSATSSASAASPRPPLRHGARRELSDTETAAAYVPVHVLGTLTSDRLGVRNHQTILRIAAKVHAQPTWLRRLRTLPYRQAQRELQTIKGVGKWVSGIWMHQWHPQSHGHYLTGDVSVQNALVALFGPTHDVRDPRRADAWAQRHLRAIDAANGVTHARNGWWCRLLQAYAYRRKLRRV